MATKKPAQDEAPEAEGEDEEVGDGTIPNVQAEPVHASQAAEDVRDAQVAEPNA